MVECLAPRERAVARNCCNLTEHMRERGRTRGESIDRHQITKWYRRLTVSGKQWPKNLPFFGPPVGTLPKNLPFFAPPIYALPNFRQFFGKVENAISKKPAKFRPVFRSLEPPHWKQASQSEFRRGQKSTKIAKKSPVFWRFGFANLRAAANSDRRGGEGGRPAGPGPVPYIKHYFIY